jgi:hypothetical protein
MMIFVIHCRLALVNLVNELPPLPSIKEQEMKFIMTFAFKPDLRARDEAIARFKMNGGVPPQGVKLLGRWTRADLNGGFDLLESDDLVALGELALRWSDLLDLSIVPVMEDEVLNEVLRRGAN